MFSTHLYVKSSTGTINHDKVFLYYLKGVAQNLQLTKMVVLLPFLANSAPSTLNLGSDGYLEVLNRSWLQRYDTIEKTHKNTKITKKKQETEVFAFCAINLEPIEVQTHSAPQNDHLNCQISWHKNS